MKRRATILTVAFSVLLPVSVFAQARYDDHELTDRFYITLGGYSQDDVRTTFRLDAKTLNGGIALGTVIGLESLFDVENEVTTARLDGWYRFNKKHRIRWTWWDRDREGVQTYTDDVDIEIGDITITAGDTVTTTDDSGLLALSWSFSFVNTSKYEAWIGAGLNFQSIDITIGTDIGGGGSVRSVQADGTVPIPTVNFGGRWNFSKRTRMFLTGELFGIDVGDYSGRLDNTRLLAEFNITKHFGIGGGFERNNFEVDAESDDFLGSFDASYTAFTLYIKGQL